MCTRCLRGFEDRTGPADDDESIITGTEGDDRSLIDLIQNADAPQVYRSSVTIKVISRVIGFFLSKIPLVDTSFLLDELSVFAL